MLCLYLTLFLGQALYWKITFIEASKICPASDEILPCRCSLKEELIQIWCSHTTLPQIIEGIKAIASTTTNTIDEFILENNQLPALPGKFFGALKIIRLMIRHNNIERVSTGWLNDLEQNLAEIFIDELNLRSIPSQSLNGFENLKAITIQSNELKRLPSFSGLLNLKYISLHSRRFPDNEFNTMNDFSNSKFVYFNSGDHISQLESEVFENLPSVKTIDLSRNEINSIHLRTFYRLPNLNVLKLSKNNISDVGMVGRAIKDLENLEKLYLDNNIVSVLSEGSLVDLPSLTELYLHNNLIVNIQYGSFHKTPNLKVVHLQNNKIRRIHPESFMQPSGSGIESVYLHNNKIDHVEELRSLLYALPALKYLDLTRNLLTEIPFGILHGHGTIEQLHLNDNLIRSIDRDALMGMPALRELRLGNNSLSDNLGMPFWNLPGLKGLDLSQNQFRKINSVLLNGLPSVRRLDLSQNLLTYINPNSFIHSPMLETLNLSFNQITTIHQTTFKNLDRLFEIDMSNNQLQEIVPGLPKIVERVLLRNNMISSLPNPTSKLLNLPNLRMMDISNNILEYVPNYTLQFLSQLRVLSFATNRIGVIEENTFLGADQLEILDLQDNQINYIEDQSFQFMKNLKDLNLQGNKIASLTENVFKNLTNLKKLDLSRNVISELHPLVFRNLIKLQFMDLSDNVLTAFPESSSNLISLNVIDVSFNRLTVLPSIIIDTWKNVVLIRLSSNQIRSLNNGNVRNLPKLQYLDLSSNEIDSIEPDAFLNLPELQELVLADNKLIELKEHIFENVPNLLAIHLQHNLLRFISAEIFFHTPSLVYLNLSANHFENMDYIGLNNINSLEVLDLSYNNIKVIKADPIKKLIWLVELKIDDNQICKIHGQPFDTMPRLRVLSFRNNLLRTMNERIFRNLRGNLAILNMDGNPIRCSCEMLWLKVWLDETNSLNPGPKCKNGKLLRASRFDKNKCEDNEIRSSTYEHLPLLNEHGDIFSRHLDEKFTEDCEENFSEDKRHPLPNESEYFYDQYIDYPMTDHDKAINYINLTDSIQPAKPVKQNNLQNFENANHTVLNYNLYNRPRPTQNSSPFTFFGYPLPSFSFGRFMNPRARFSESGNILNFPISNKSRMFQSNEKVFDEKLTRQTQFNDVSSRRNHVNINNSNENFSFEDSNSFKTFFKNPLPEKGGFLPLMPAHVGGFIPVNPLRKNIINLTNFTKSSSNIEENQKKIVMSNEMIPLIPITKESIQKKIKNVTILERKSLLNDIGFQSSPKLTTTEINEPLEQNLQMTERTENISEPSKKIQTVDESTNNVSIISDIDIFPPSTSETILLVPPTEEQESFNIQDFQRRNENVEKDKFVRKQSPSQARLAGSKSIIVKVFTPKTSLKIPAAEEYFRTTMNPKSDNEYQSNEFVTTTAYVHLEELSKNSGLDWYFDSYRSKKERVLENEIETIKSIRKNNVDGRRFGNLVFVIFSTCFNSIFRPIA